MSWEERMVLTRRELERVAEAAKARADAAEKESQELKKELDQRRHTGRRNLNRLAESFREKESKEKSLRVNAERKVERLQHQMKQLMQNGGGGGSSGASPTLPRRVAAPPSANADRLKDKEKEKKALPVPSAKASDAVFTILLCGVLPGLHRVVPKHATPAWAGCTGCPLVCGGGGWIST